MISFRHSGIIHAPVKEVFAIVADPEKIPLWRKDVPAITHMSGRPMAGTTFLEEVHFMGKKKLLMKITEFIPDKKIVIEGQSGMAMLPSQKFAFISEGSNTRLDLEVNMKVSGVFKLMEFILPAMLKKIWKKYFVSLDQLASQHLNI